MELLEELDSVDWRDLSHAHGTAEDVPRHIRALLSQDKSKWEEARVFFWESVWHQGTVYSVTAHTIPFLARLLSIENVMHREEILILLHALANGHSYTEVHYHLDPQWMDEHFAEQGTDYESQLRLERGYVERSRKAVLEHYELYVPLLGHKDPKLVGHAIYLLSDLSELPIDHFHLFKNIFQQHTSDEVKNSALHGIRNLNLDPGSKKTFFEGVFDSVDNYRLKSTAAIGAFEAAERHYRSDIFEYLLDFYQFLRNETEYGWLSRDLVYPDPWGPGISTSQIARACIAVGSLQNLFEVRRLSSVMEEPVEVFSLMKDAMFELFASEIHEEVTYTSAWRDGTYVVDFFSKRNRERLPLESKATVFPEIHRDVIELLLSLDKFWEVESNLLRFFGLPHSRSELKQLYDSRS